MVESSEVAPTFLERRKNFMKEAGGLLKLIEVHDKVFWKDKRWPECPVT